MRSLALTAALAMALIAGCRSSLVFSPSPARTWRDALASARQAADSGLWASADRRLADYAARNPSSAEAKESLYWRGVFRLASGPDSAAQREGAATLEQYLATAHPAHRVEARAFLAASSARVALQRELDGREREIAQVRTALGRAQETRATPAGERPRDDRALVEEIERLKAELTKANQELERIKRRLAGQSPNRP